MFASFFSNKVLKLHSALKSQLTNTSPHTEPSHVPTSLTFFYPVTREEFSKLISQSSSTFCDLDPIPTSILKQCLSTLLPTITNIVNLSKFWCLSQTVQAFLCYSSSEEILSGQGRSFQLQTYLTSLISI